MIQISSEGYWLVFLLSFTWAGNQTGLFSRLLMTITVVHPLFWNSQEGRDPKMSPISLRLWPKLYQIVIALLSTALGFESLRAAAFSRLASHSEPAPAKSHRNSSGFQKQRLLVVFIALHCSLQRHQPWLLLDFDASGLWCDQLQGYQRTILCWR